jgi:TrmH family RNA methyltransferase
MSLDNIRIVLSRPTHPGNIGAVARAMKNMRLQRLVLLAPEADYQDPEATARATGAVDVLTQATVCTSLDEALVGCQLVLGTSARERAIAWPTLSPREAAARLTEEAEQGQVALLFGQERAGLTNTELDRCHALVTIPSNPAFSSLNLASAVQILTYEVFLQTEGARPPVPRQEGGGALATDDELQGFYRHLEEVLLQVAFLDPAHPRRLMRRLIRLFNRARVDQNELNILRGILTAVQQTQHWRR